MQSSSPGYISAAYLPLTRDFPEDSEAFRNFFIKVYTEIAQAVNRRTVGVYDTVQITTGNKYYPVNSNSIQVPVQQRQSYRQIYPFGAVAQGATLTIPHGISNPTQFVSIYGSAITDGSVTATAIYIPLPYVSATNVTFQVEIDVDGTNIYIVNGAGANNITSGNVILEYLLN